MAGKRKLLVAAAILLGAPIVGFLAWFNYKDYKASKTVIEYHVAKGYRGWVAIRYGVASAPALPFVKDGVGGTYTITVPSSGYLETSSPVYPGFHRERFYDGDALVEGADRGDGRIWGEAFTGEGCQVFFVAFDHPMPSDEEPKSYDFPGGCK